MKKQINILVLGCKEWPYGSSKGYDEKVGGGTGKYVTNLVNSFKKSSVNWIILTRRFPSQKKLEKINNNLSIYRTSSITNKFLRLPLMNLFFFSLANKIINKEKIDIIFSHGLFPSYLGYCLKKHNQNKFLISRPAGMVYVQYNFIIKWIFKLFEQITYSKSDKLVFLSKDEKGFFKKNLKFKNFNKKSVVISTGALINESNANKYTPSECFRLLFIGRLSPVKNLDLVIKAVSQLKKIGIENITLEIVGSGSELFKLKKLVNFFKE
ncbi:glycosyltransferase [Candidatus Woesearchaeota archaeon]|nr:glycosyltransferase [Candidatus Woesearchaeota archaeon]